MMSFRNKSKWVIGLTGSMLSGKSTALAYFARCGACTLSCDDLARELRSRPTVQRKIQAALGTADKAQLANLVFKSAAKRQALENILHPLLLKEVRAQIKKTDKPCVVVEAPLLFEAGWDKLTDLNIVVLADPKTLPARLKERNLTRAEFNRRTQHQWPDEKKAQHADVVFFHATKAQLKKSVERFCNVLEVLPHQ